MHSLGAWQNLWPFYSIAHAAILNEHFCEIRLRERSKLKDLGVFGCFSDVLVRMPNASALTRSFCGETNASVTRCTVVLLLWPLVN